MKSWGLFIAGVITGIILMGFINILKISSNNEETKGTGCSIFMPEKIWVNGSGETIYNGLYWSSTLYENYEKNAYSFGLNNNKISNGLRYKGNFIRPISK